MDAVDAGRETSKSIWKLFEANKIGWSWTSMFGSSMQGEEGVSGPDSEGKEVSDQVGEGVAALEASAQRTCFADIALDEM